MINSPLDFYDDPSGSVLKGRLTSIDAVPDFIKTAERMDEETLNKLPDDVFALVALDGGRKMRKFACVDKGNTALSVIYFMENKDQLPIEAQKTAAANLITACGWYDLAPPAELEKVASDPRQLAWENRWEVKRKKALGPMPSDPGAKAAWVEKARAWEKKNPGSDSYLMPGTVDTPKPGSTPPWTKKAKVEKVALLGAAMGALTMGQGIAEGHKDYKKRQAAMKAGVPAGQAFKMKSGELAGSNVMPYGRGGEKTAAAFVPPKVKPVKAVKPFKPKPLKQPKPKVVTMKKASLEPHVDITGRQPPPQVVKETGRFYALTKEGGARYPIDTAMQVQRAYTYFEKYAGSFAPHERREFCANVCRRADELGLKIPANIAKYGSAKMAEDVGVQIYRRQRLFREGTSEHSLLQEMREKCASIRPEVLAVALEKFDRDNNLDQQWDNGLPDPYYSVFGVEKVAEWTFVDGNDRIDETRLNRLSKEVTFRKTICEHFGKDMLEEFVSNPKQIFDSLPLDSKRIIMRMSQQVEE